MRSGKAMEYLFALREGKRRFAPRTSAKRQEREGGSNFLELRCGAASSPFLFAQHLISNLSNAATQIRPNGTKGASVAQFEVECVKFFAEAVQLFGIPKSVGQIYGLLYASPRPLGFLDIVERLEISKGSASQGMQLLRELGAINEVRAKRNGNETATIDDLMVSRGVRVLYEPELSLRRLVSGVLRERIAPMTATSAERLAKLRSLAELLGSDGKFYVGRAKQLNTWRRRFRAVLPVFTALLGPKRK